MSNWCIIPNNNDLMHYGVLGMKWGVRRYQNEDGTLTNAGKERYGSNKQKAAYKLDNAMGFLSRTQPGNRQKEYAIQKKMVKNTEGYKSLMKTDVGNLRRQKKLNKKIIDSIREERSPEAAGAFLKDLGYKDTPNGREEILKLFNSKELKSMATANQASRIAQLTIAGAIGSYFVNKYAGPALGKKIIEYYGNTAKAKNFIEGVNNRKNQIAETYANTKQDAERIFDEVKKSENIINEHSMNVKNDSERILTEYKRYEDIITENKLNEIKIRDINVNRINPKEITWNNVTTWDNSPDIKRW